MLIIGIAGGTGSGKTTFVDQIVAELPPDKVGVISQDSYYNDNTHLSFEEREKINFDHPQSIDFNLLVSHLRTLRQGKSFEQPVYSFVEHNRTGQTITTFPKKVIIVEGILILAHPAVRDLFDVKIFMEADSDERLIRRLKRDIATRGRNLEEILDRYQNTLKPMHIQFIEPTREFADIIISTNNRNTVDFTVIKTIIHQEINRTES